MYNAFRSLRDTRLLRNQCLQEFLGRSRKKIAGVLIQIFRIVAGIVQLLVYSSDHFERSSLRDRTMVVTLQ